MDITEFLGRDEDKTFELKRDLSSPNGIIKSIVAFANTAGGILIVGVEDKTKFVIGVDKPLECEERIASFLFDNIEPKLAPEIEIIPWRKTYLMKIEIYPSAVRPHFHKKHGLENGTYIRVGSTNRKADRTMIHELQRSQRLKTFDEEICSEFHSEDIDFEAASECFSNIQKNT